MADKKITQLTNITGANLVDADEFVVVDISADETKAITLGELKEAFDSGSGFVRITGDTMTGDLSFGDNVDANFGASSDLKIFHDAGGTSHIRESGSSHLYIEASNLRLKSSVDTGETYLTANLGGAVELYYDNSTKLATTSTGIDVTGTVTADGLTVNSGGVNTVATFTSTDIVADIEITDTGGTATLRVNNGNFQLLGNSGANFVENSGYEFKNGGTLISRFANNGDISFYDSTGTTPKFFWDASAESLGIGAAPSTHTLEVWRSGGDHLLLGRAGVGTYELGVSSNNALTFEDGGTERMRIDSSGNVGIGTSSPSVPLHVNTSGTSMARFVGGNDGNLYITNDSANVVTLQAAGGDALSFNTNGGNERMRIDSSGNVGIGVVPSAWNSAIKGFQIGISGSAYSSSTSQLNLHANAYYGASGFNYINTAAASYYSQLSGSHIFSTAASGTADTAISWSEAMRIDSSGALLVGKTSADFGATVGMEMRNNDTLYVARSGGGALALNRLSSDGDIAEFRKDGSTVGSIGSNASGGTPVLDISTNATSGIMRMLTSGSEAMRIDSSGNLLVGTTDSTPYNNSAGSTADNGITIGATGIFSAAKYNDHPVILNRTGTDGDIVDFRKNGSTVGSIGTGGGDLYLTSKSGVAYYIYDGSISPGNDNIRDLGQVSYRWDDIYATNGTIQTSDRNEKQDIEALSDAEQRVAVACKGLLRKFRWKDAVAEKGNDARIHFGIIAQDLQDAFTAEGLDAGRYAMFISSTWWETQTEVPAVEAVAEVLDEDGNVVTEAVEAKEAYTRTDTYETAEEAPEGATERTRLGVRYPELLAFIIAAI